MIVAILVLIQSTTVSAPPQPGQQEGIEWAKNMVMSTPVAVGTSSKPAIVPDDQMWDPKTLVNRHKSIAKNAEETGAASILPMVAADIGFGCAKSSEHPAGFELGDSNVLSGMSTIYSCGDFVTELERQDFSHPLKVGTAVGFAPDKLSSVFNGGALAKNFRRSRSGTYQVTYTWIGKQNSIILALTSRTMDHTSLDVRATGMIDTLTRGARAR